MSRRVARIYGGTPYINIFELDENIYKSNIYCNHDNKYDLVLGPLTALTIVGAFPIGVSAKKR